MGQLMMVELVLAKSRHIRGVERPAAYKMAQARLAEGLTVEDLQKAIICGHLEAKAIDANDVHDNQETTRATGKRRGKRRGRA